MVALVTHKQAFLFTRMFFLFVLFLAFLLVFLFSWFFSFKKRYTPCMFRNIDGFMQGNNFNSIAGIAKTRLCKKTKQNKKSGESYKKQFHFLR